MIDKKKKKQVKKIIPKTKNCPSRPRRPPTMKKSRYSQKYLENRNKMRSKILEKANETFYCELSNLDDRMCIEEEEIVRPVVTFNEMPTYITLKKERVPARNQKMTSNINNSGGMRNFVLKPILRKY